MSRGVPRVPAATVAVVAALAASAGMTPAPGPQEAPAPAATAVTIPGGEGLVRSVLGLGPPGSDLLPGGLLVAVADRLARPDDVDGAGRLAAALDELAELREELARLDRTFGTAPARLAEPGSDAHRKAEALLDWLGFAVDRQGEEVRLRRRVGDRQAERRRLLDQMGIRLALQARLWAGGESIRLEVEDGSAPLPFGLDAWNDAVFDRPVEAGDAFRELLDHPPARDAMLGFARLDRATRDLVYGRVGLAPLARDARVAEGFRRIAPYLRAEGETLHLPGGDHDAWEALLGRWDGTGELLTALAIRDDRRPAHLWRALSLLPPATAHYLLTLDRPTREERAGWARELAGSLRPPGIGGGLRWPDDAADLFVELRLDPAAGSIAWPGGARAWVAAFAEGSSALTGPGEVDALLERHAGVADRGPEVDARLLTTLLAGSDPTRDGPTAIEVYRTVAGVLRYQPPGRVAGAVPVLVRNHRRFGRAWGLLAMPVPLQPATVQALARGFEVVDGLDEPVVRLESIRQLQASLMLLRRLLLNGSVRPAAADELLVDLVGIVPDGSTGHGPALTSWWRQELVPRVADSLVAAGWAGDPTDVRAVLVAGLVGRITPGRLQVDGIPYEAVPARTLGRRLQVNVAGQQLPRLDQLLRIDAIAGRFLELAAGSPAGGSQEAGDGARAGEGDDGGEADAAADGDVEQARGDEAAGLADDLEAILDDLRERLPPNVVAGEVDFALPVPVGRDRLFAAGDELVRRLRGEPAAGGPPEAPEELAGRVREAVTAYLGDALTGLVYGLHMGDPDTYAFQHPHLAWIHAIGFVERPDGIARELFGSWAPTAEGWAGNEGQRLQNSLFGVPDVLGAWTLGQRLAGSGERIAEETWGATLGRLHVPSLHPSIQALVARRHALGGSWVEAAAAAGDADLPAPFATDDTAPGLRERARLLLRPWELQRLVDAVEARDATAALAAVTPGNRYLLAHAVDGDDDLPAELRWSLDQGVGLPLGRRGEYLGLGHPPLLPYGEVGDELGDPRLYSRLLDVRVLLAVAMEEQGLPAPFQARLLADAMAGILREVPVLAARPWHEMLGAVDRVVGRAAVHRWLVDMAFEDEFLAAADPLAALDEAEQRVSGRAGGELTLPVEGQEAQAAFGARVDMVLVDVGVWDEQGRFVTDLSLDDVEVSWEGMPVEPEFLRLEGSPRSTIFLDDLDPEVAARVETRPRNFVLVADLLSTTPQDWERVLADTLEFVRAGITSDDRLALVAIDDRGRPRALQDFTVDHEVVVGQLEGLRGNAFGAREIQDAVVEVSRLLCDNGSCTDPENPENCETFVSSSRFPRCITLAEDWEDQKFRIATSQVGLWQNQQAQRSQRILDALEEVGTMIELGDPLDRAKVLVLLSTGFEVRPGSLLYEVLVDYASATDLLDPLEVRTPRLDLGDELADVATLMRRCRCTVYSLGTSGLGTFDEGPGASRFPLAVAGSALRRNLQDPLNAISRDTGGRPFFGSDPGRGFEQVLEDTRLRWVVGFSVAAQTTLPEGADPDGEPRWHDLEVRVSRPDVQVRAREGFLWPPRR